MSYFLLNKVAKESKIPAIVKFNFFKSIHKNEELQNPYYLLNTTRVLPSSYLPLQILCRFALKKNFSFPLNVNMGTNLSSKPYFNLIFFSIFLILQLIFQFHFKRNKTNNEITKFSF